VGRLFFRIFLWFWSGTTLLLAVLVTGFLIIQPDPDVLASWRLIGRGAIGAVGSLAANSFEREGSAGVDRVLAS